jgi:hypothetical protein
VTTMCFITFFTINDIIYIHSDIFTPLQNLIDGTKYKSEMSKCKNPGPIIKEYTKLQFTKLCKVGYNFYNILSNKEKLELCLNRDYDSDNYIHFGNELYHIDISKKAEKIMNE